MMSHSALYCLAIETSVQSHAQRSTNMQEVTAAVALLKEVDPQGIYQAVAGIETEKLTRADLISQGVMDFGVITNNLAESGSISCAYFKLPYC
jgi:hypothetical protein